MLRAGECELSPGIQLYQRMGVGFVLKEGRHFLTVIGSVLATKDCISY